MTTSSGNNEVITLRRPRFRLSASARTDIATPSSSICRCDVRAQRLDHLLQASFVRIDGERREDQPQGAVPRDQLGHGVLVHRLDPEAYAREPSLRPRRSIVALGRPPIFPAGEQHHHALDRQRRPVWSREVGLCEREENVVFVDAKRHVCCHLDLPLDVEQPRFAADKDLQRPVEFSELLSGASWKNTFVQPGARRLVSFPAGISSTLRHLLVTELGGAQAKVHSVAVQGTLPSGWIEAVVYEPSLDAFVVMMLSDEPRRVEVVTLKIDASTATFTTVVQSAPVDPKYLFALAATGSGGVVVAQGSAGMQTLTIKGNAGTWGAPVAQAGGLFGPLSLSTPSPVVPDPAKGRLLAFGADVVDPVQMKPVYHAGLYEMVLAPPYAWNEVPLAGSGPPDNGATVGFTPGLVLDKTGNRAFVSASVKGDCSGMPCFMNQGWSADFTKTAWTALDASAGSGPGTPWAVDDEGRRTLASQGDLLLATSLADADLFKSSVVPQDGLLGSLTDDLIPAAILPDGRLITIDFTMRVLDLKSAAPRWDRFGTATPSTDRPSGQLAVDAESGAVYTLVGPKNDLQIIAADGSSIKGIPTTGAPPARSGYGTLFIQKTLYLAGGSDANGATLDDVWALDLGSSAWKRLASLPMGMTRVTLRTGADGELLALGYLPGTTYQMGPVVSIDIHKGTTHALEAKGDVPPQAFWTFAPLGTGFVGIEGGGVVGDTLPNRWTVVRDGDAMTWSKTGLVETGYAITGLVGAGATDGQHAAFVGSRVFEAKVQSAGM